MGALLLLCSAVGIAVLLIKREETVLARTRAILEVVVFVRERVDVYSMSATQIFFDMGEEKLRACGYDMSSGFPESFSDMYLQCDIPDAQTRNAFFEFARDFGSSYRVQEVQKCDACAEKIKKREQELSARLPEKRKMIFVISVCTSLMLLILLI
jgi:hypothetical protein